MNLKASIKIKGLLIAALVHLSYMISHACSPLNTPSATFTMSGTDMLMTISNTSSWLQCPNIIAVEFACQNNNFSGLSSDTYSTLPQSFASSPYTYNTQTISIAGLCPGSAYKFRIREQNSPSGAASSWSSIFTFTTPGIFIQPSLSLSAAPNLICPPQLVQLSAQVTNSCGLSANLNYLWIPSTGLSNPNIANPTANITNPTTYTCIVTGGASGCWSVTSSIFLNVGSGPPVPGIASVNPPVICVNNSATLTVTSGTGTIQWQSSASALGPWTNIPGATSATAVLPSIPATTCYRAMFTSCTGATLASNAACVVTNPLPVLTPSTGCSNTVTLLSFTQTGSSGTPTSVVWSPAPQSLNTGSTVATYNSNGSVFAIAYFPDGCISSTSFAVVSPSVSINASSVSCASLGSATVTVSNITGPLTYSWLPVAQSGSVATGLFPSTVTCNVGYNNSNCYATATLNLPATTPLTGTVQASPAVLCPGLSTGTAAVQLVGGSGSSSYIWTNGITSLGTPTVSGLASGIYTVTVTDQITFCSLTHTFNINPVPAFTITITPTSPTACIGSTVGLAASNSGGTPGYSYTWTAGPGAPSRTVSEATSGQYTYVVSSTDINQCTSSKPIVITFIDKPQINVSNISICPFKTGTLTATGATSYTWNNNPGATGSTFTVNPGVATTYSVMGEAQTCTNTATVSVQMLTVPVPTITQNGPLCNGQGLSLSAAGGISYRWSGPNSFTSAIQNNYFPSPVASQSGIYNVTVTSVSTCTASASTSITIYPSPPLTAFGSTVCSTGTVSLFGNSNPGVTFHWTGPAAFSSTLQNPAISTPSVSNSGNYTVKATSPEGCTTTAVAHVTVTQQPTPAITSDTPKCTGDNLHLYGSGGISYSWIGPAAFASNVQNPVITAVPFAGGGTYFLTVTTGPCIATTSSSVTIFALPTVTAINVTTNATVCAGKTFSFSSQTGGSVISYLWTGPAFSSTLANPVRPTASELHNGTYTLTVTDMNNCHASDSTKVLIHRNPNIAATGATVCLFQPALLTANGANSYYWEGPNFFSSTNPMPALARVSNSIAGIYTVTGKAANTCTSVTTVTVATKNLPTASLTVYPSNTVCLNTTVRLEGFGGEHYRWLGPGDSFYPGKVASFMTNNLGFAGTYTLFASDTAGCYGEVTTRIEIYNLPEAILKGKVEGCVPLCSSYGMQAINNSTTIGGTWEINSRKYPANFSHCFYEPGIYTITGSFYDSSTTCTSTKKYIVDVFAVPEARFEIAPKEPVENLDDVLFINQSLGENLTKYQWSFNTALWGASSYTSGLQNTSYFFQDAGTYPVAMVVQNEWGCSDTIVKAISILKDFNVYVPNVFTPNGDKDNELFKPVTRGVKLYEFSIYNRWGTRVFHSADPSEGWDGTFNNGQCKSDVYNWVISVSGIHGENKKLSGHVTLYR